MIPPVPLLIKVAALSAATPIACGTYEIAATLIIWKTHHLLKLAMQTQNKLNQ
ncbi:hypothetical protein [Yersinia aleksiciae]|uniref:hypothetical protein n=1 Tax=Yersinia aleksiciae TaxID=263819 RepID=UPI0022FF3AAD|nr:hypothetical protein [Yersinia aleksiciae]MDA5496361.1 hypothetical protein [Yersinia aleksiciae]